MTHKQCDEYCIGCLHYRHFDEFVHACHYTLDTGEYRGCPAGRGCLRWESTSPEDRVKELRQRRSEQLSEATFGARKGRRR